MCLEKFERWSCVSSTSLSMEVCHFSRKDFLTSFSSVGPTLSFFCTDFVTHSSHTMMFSFSEGSCVVGNVCNCCMSCTCRTCRCRNTHWPAQCPLERMWLRFPAFYLQAKIFMCFTSTCLSVCYSMVDDPKWLTELRHRKFVPGILSLKSSMKICHVVCQGSLVKYLALFSNFTRFAINYSRNFILVKEQDSNNSAH